MSFEESEFEKLIDLVEKGDLTSFNDFIKINNLSREQANAALLRSLNSYSESISYSSHDKHDQGATCSTYLSKDLSHQLTKYISRGVKSITFRGDPLFHAAAKEKLVKIETQQVFKVEFLSIFHLQIARKLITLAENKVLQKALVLAAERLDLELVQLIINKLNESEKNFSNALGEALNKAVEKDNIEMCKLLLQHGAEQISNKHGFFPLHLAASKEAVLLLAKSNLNQPTVVAKYNENNEANTPLHLAVKENKLDVIETLLEQLADSNITNNKGETILHFAIFYFQQLKLLIEKYRCSKLINVQDNNGNTPLHVLLKNSSYNKQYSEIILYLIKQGADLNIINKNNETVLHLLSSTLLELNPKVYEAILSGSNINFCDIQEKTAAHRAAEKTYDLTWLNQLLDAGTDINLQDNQGNTILLVLMKELCRHSIERSDESYAETLLKLIKNLKNINIANKSGETCLHYLAKLGYIEGIKAAVEKGAIVDVVNEYQQTPALYALACGQIDAVSCLKDLGANLNLIIQAEVVQTDSYSYASEFTKQAQTQYRLLFPQDNKDKQFSIYLAITMLQYTRWSLTPQQQEEVYQDYFNSLQHLINQFGKENFVNAVKELMDEHKDSLDITNIYEYGAHSDRSPIPHSYMLSAKFILSDKYQLNMQTYGHLVNVKTLFGDIGFWKIMQKNNNDIYQELITHIQKWPDTQQFNATYCRGNHKPLELFETFFTEAFQFIRKDLGLESETSVTVSSLRLYQTQYRNVYQPVTFQNPNVSQTPTSSSSKKEEIKGENCLIL